MPIDKDVFDAADAILNQGARPMPREIVAGADDILKQADSQQVRMQRHAEADLKAREGRFLGSPFMRTVTMKAGATGGGLLARFTGHEDAANRVHRLSAAYTKAHQEMLKQQEFPGVDAVAQKTLQIGTEMTAQAPFIGLAAFGGAPAIIGQAAVTTADRSYTDALDAGKSPRAAAQHAIGMGVIEGGITSAFQMLGLGGVEKVLGRTAKPAMTAGVKETAKRFGITTGQELVEELSISLGQAMFEDHVTGVAPKGWERFKATAGDVALQTIFTSLAYSAPGEISNAGRQKLIDGRGKILQIANEGRAPTRKEWKSMGFSRFSGLTEQSRLDAVTEMADQLQQAYLSRLQEPEGPQMEIPQEFEAFMMEPAGPEGAPSGQQEAAPVQPEAAPVSPTSAEVQPEAAPVAPVEPVAAPEAPPAVETPTEPETLQGDETGTARRFTEALRADVELPGLEDAVPEERQQWVDDAIARGEKDPDWTDKLLNTLGNNKKRVLTKVEVAGLGIHIRKLKNDVEALREQAKSDDIYVAEQARHEMAEAIHQINLVTEKTKGGLTENARALNAAALAFSKDFTFSTIAAREAAEKGAPLNRKEINEISRLTDLIAKKDKTIAQLEENVRTSSVATAVRDARRRGGVKRPSRKKVQKQKKVRDAISAFKSVAFEGGKLADFVKAEAGAFNIDAILAGVKVIEAAVDLGATTFSEFWAENVSDLGFEARALFKSAWGKAQHDGIIPQMAFRKDNYADIAKYARKMLNAVVDGGVVDTDEVIAEVHEEMSKVVADFTKANTIDAITGQGNFKPGKRGRTAAQQAVADIKQQLKLQRELESIEAGAVPTTTPRTPKQDAPAVAALKNEIADAKANSQNIADDKARRAENARIAKLEQKLADVQAGKVELPARKAKAEDSDAVKNLKKQLKEAEDTSPVLKRMRAARREGDYTETLERQLADYQRRLDEDDIQPTPTRPTPTSDRIKQLKHEVEVAKGEIARRRKIHAKKNQTRTQKAFSHLAKTVDTGRTLILSLDLPLMRQAATWTFKQAATGNLKKLRAMARDAVSAARSDENLFAQMEDIRNDENAEHYEAMGIDFTDMATEIEHQEEMFAGGYLNELRRSGVPVVAHAAGGVVATNRMHVSILNHIRKDYADTFLYTMIPGGPQNMTAAQAKIIGSTINSATGRGSLGPFEQHASMMVTVFLAPKYVVSRFRTLIEIPFRLATGIGHTPETRKFVAKEVGLTMAGVAALHSLAVLAKLGAGEELEEALPEIDPRSSAAGKIQFGNTTIDPMFGLSQSLVFPTRSLAGQYKQRGSGEIKPLRKPWIGEGEGPGFGEFDMKDVWAGFLQSKLSPWLGSTLDAAAKEDIIGREVTAGGLLVGNTLPIPIRDIYSAMKALGVPGGTAAAVLMWTGMGMQTYEERASGKSAPDPYAVTE